jgi:hypothetical protein
MQTMAQGGALVLRVDLVLDLPGLRSCRQNMQGALHCALIAHTPLLKRGTVLVDVFDNGTGLQMCTC